ncbi:MAG: hypothetical protein WBW16_03020 [Bacteroidota bacterium]
MSLIPYDVTQVREYSVEGDSGEDRTIFLIGRLDYALRNRVFDEASMYSVNDKGADATATVSVRWHQRNANIVKFGLKGWKNFKDAQGKEILFDQVSVAIPDVGNRKGVSDRCLNLIQPWLAELAREILKDNRLSVEEEKN